MTVSAFDFSGTDREFGLPGIAVEQRILALSEVVTGLAEGVGGGAGNVFARQRFDHFGRRVVKAAGGRGQIFADVAKNDPEAPAFAASIPLAGRCVPTSD